MVDGNTPKVTMSANESNSFPIADCVCSNRAENPSKKSNKAPTPIMYAADTKSPLNAKTIPMQPLNKFNEVIKLGIEAFSLFIYLSFKY